MTDLLGIPLSVGDEIVYTTGAQSNTCLERGFILDIKNDCAMIKTSSGRKATNWRSTHELMSLNPAKESNPEIFI